MSADPDGETDVSRAGASARTIVVHAREDLVITAQVETSSTATKDGVPPALRASSGRKQSDPHAPGDAPLAARETQAMIRYSP